MICIFTDEQHELIKIWIADALKVQRKEIYTELKESMTSLGYMDHYNFQSIEAQCTAHTARDLADRIGWLVDES